MARDEPDVATFSYWLGRTAAEIREAAGISVEMLATKVMGETHGQSIRRFERNETHYAKTDELLAVLAQLAGLDDARDVYALAVSRWQKNGEPPSPPATVGTALQIAELRAAEKALLESLPGPDGKPRGSARASKRGSGSAKPAA